MAESISEGTLKTWMKKVGDHVEADEEIASIETDKVRKGQSLIPRHSRLR
jgi:2-oxoglutarate dehydrogenase E2 component (dihydrolipoamide succinyltransferase)